MKRAGGRPGGEGVGTAPLDAPPVNGVARRSYENGLTESVGVETGAPDVASDAPGAAAGRHDPWKDVLLRRLIAAADVAAVLAGGLAVGLTAESGLASALWWAGSLPLWIFVGKLHGLYDQDHVRIRHLTSDELPALFHWATVSAAAVTLILALGPAALWTGAAFAGWAVVLVAAVLLRLAARMVWRRLVPPERGVVIGQGQLADALARKLTLEPGHHLALVASVVPGEPNEHAGGAAAGGEPLEVLPELANTLQRERAERVVLAMADLDETTLARVVATCRALGVKLSVAPPLRAMLGTAVTLSHLAELPLIEFKTWDPSRSTAFLKRSFDVTLSAAGLITLAPLLALTAVLIRIDSPGPALFRQRRAGERGVPFEVLKFRTMVRDAEDRLDEVVRLDELPEPSFKLRSDPRVTRVGRILRKTSLDEVPQLLNVLRGEMSLVGPRPEQLRLVERYTPEMRFRLEMRPGITGPMQVHGRGELTFQEWVAVEREYMENYSLQKDVKILLATPLAVMRRKGAF
jgi:exopolysaccharide biosynthesis polyprenyl glycosylphosphotransferase